MVLSWQSVGDSRVDLEEQIILAQKDKNILNSILLDYKPFIQKNVYEICRRYLEWGKDEELQIGLLAFEEAVQRYSKEKGSFLYLAKRVIQSRIIDYLRKEERNYHQSLESIVEPVFDNTYTAMLKEEIIELQKHLSLLEISFNDLVKVSPSKRELREELKLAAIKLTKYPEIVQELLVKRELAIQKIVFITSLPYKKIERNRIYFITLILIWYFDLPLLQGFIK